MSLYLDDARRRAEQKLQGKVQASQEALALFHATGQDISSHLNPAVSPPMKVARWTNLRLASKRLAPEGFEPELLLEKWPVLSPELRVKAGVRVETRDTVLRLDRGCSGCGLKESTTVDHVIPRARGGSNRIGNPVGSCYECNEFKADFVPKELGWVLRLSLRAYGDGLATLPGT